MEIKTPYTQKEIERVICRHFEVTKLQLHGRTNKGQIGEAKKACYFLLYNHVIQNKSAVGQMVGRSNSSGIAIIEKMTELYEFDKQFQSRIERLRNELKK